MTIEFGDSETVGSEFAQVSVQFDAEANSPRLRLEDLRTGRVRYLDALELETIIWLPEDHLGSLLDPSHSRWRGEDPE
jgi:sugar phosphate isomerase/epimerase